MSCSVGPEKLEGLDWLFIIHEIVRLRECEELPFTFVQIAGILNARFMAVRLTADLVRDLYCQQRVEDGIIPRGSSDYLEIIDSE